jgi:hypothetical protein
MSKSRIFWRRGFAASFRLPVHPVNELGWIGFPCAVLLELEGVEGDLKFSVPGHDGELPQGTNIWRKGMVYTPRSPGSYGVGQGYRVSAGIK